jgi:TPP-dependent pyruvate/acetoin dehydrogenase alpha subunit
LIKQGKLTPEEVKRIDQEVSEAIAEAVRYADRSPQPDIQVALQDIYA